MKFPVFRTTLQIFEDTWNDRRALLRYGAVPFLISLAAFYGATAYGINVSQPTQDQVGPLVVLALLQLLIYLPFTVTWYRRVVLGPGETQAASTFKFSRLEGRFLLWQVLLGLAVGLYVVAGACVIAVIYLVLQFVGQEAAATAVSVILGVAVFVGAFLILARLSMVLVFAALGQPVKFKVSWQMTKGLGWRLVGVFVLIGLASWIAGLLFKLVAFIFGAVAATITSAGLGQVMQYFVVFGQCLTAVATVAASAALLGFVYKLLMEHASSSAPAMQPVNDGT